MKLGAPMTADGGSSPMVKPKGDKQVEYLDLDLDPGKSTPPRKVGAASWVQFGDLSHFKTKTRFCLSVEEQRNWHGGIRRARGLRGRGPATDTSPQEHQGGLERRPPVHRDGQPFQRIQVTLTLQNPAHPPSPHPPPAHRALMHQLCLVGRPSGGV